MYEQKCITFIPTVSSAFWFIVHKFWMLTRIKRKIPKRMCAFIKRLKIISKSFWRLYGFVDYFTLKIHCSHYLNLRNIFFFSNYHISWYWHQPWQHKMQKIYYSLDLSVIYSSGHYGCFSRILVGIYCKDWKFPS